MYSLLLIALTVLTASQTAHGQIVSAPAAPPAGVRFQDGILYRWSYDCNYENVNSRFGRFKSNVKPCSEQCLIDDTCIYFTVDHQNNCYLQKDGLLKATRDYKACGYIVSRGSFNGGISGDIHFHGHIGSSGPKVGSNAPGNSAVFNP